MLIKKIEDDHFLPTNSFLFDTSGVTNSIFRVFILYMSYKNVNNMAILKDLNLIQEPVLQHAEVI